MKNKGLSLLLLLLGGAAVYYYIKNKKPKLKGEIIVDPLGPGEFPDDSGNFPSDYEQFPLIPKGYTTEQISTQLNSANNSTMTILEQIKEVSKPRQVDSYQTFYGSSINGKKVGVPHSI